MIEFYGQCYSNLVIMEWTKVTYEKKRKNTQNEINKKTSLGKWRYMIKKDCTLTEEEKRMVEEYEIEHETYYSLVSAHHDYKIEQIIGRPFYSYYGIYYYHNDAQVLINDETREVDVSWEKNNHIDYKNEYVINGKILRPTG